jgi:hypothetical protein
MKIKSFIIVSMINDLKQSYDSKKIDEIEYLKRYVSLIYELYNTEKGPITKEEFEKLDVKVFADFIDAIFKELNSSFLTKTA